MWRASTWLYTFFLIQQFMKREVFSCGTRRTLCLLQNWTTHTRPVRKWVCPHLINGVRSLLSVVPHIEWTPVSLLRKSDYTTNCPPSTSPASPACFSRNTSTYHISIYAAHLYDSVMLYARALDNLIHMQKAEGREVDVAALARDGEAITDAIIGMAGYESISGNFIRIDENGDSEGNFTAFALKEHNYTFVSRISGKTKFSCTHYPIKVGEFHSERTLQNTTNITYSPKVNIDWPRNHKPVDEPHCGYDGGKCPRLRGRTEIAAGILGAILVGVIFVTCSMYRKWKIEQEIEGLLWKINPDCLQVEKSQVFVYLLQFCSYLYMLLGISWASSLSVQAESWQCYQWGIPMLLCLSQLPCSKVPSSLMFMESRLKYYFRYKGYFVRIKEIVFDKKKDIPRDVMKEMKLMRELRHDNVNRYCRIQFLIYRFYLMIVKLFFSVSLVHVWNLMQSC